MIQLDMKHILKCLGYTEVQSDIVRRRILDPDRPTEVLPETPTITYPLPDPPEFRLLSQIT